MTTKICCTCKKEKPGDCFSRNKRSKDGYKEYCKECASIKTALYRESHKEQIRESARKSYHKSKQNAEEKTKQQESLSTRICSVCGIEKPLTEYYKCGNGGYRTYCKLCANKKARDYHKAHREEIVDKKREYNRENKSRIDAYNKQYYNEHSDEIKTKVRDWEKEHVDTKREHGVFYFHTSRSKREGVKSDFTRGDWKQCKEYFSVDGKVHCAYCGKEMKKATMEHVIPFEHGGEYTKSNIIPVCVSCNASKGKADLSEWYPKQPFYSVERENKIKAYLNQ